MSDTMDLMSDANGGEAVRPDWRKVLANEPEDMDDDSEQPADELLKGVLGFDPDDLF